MTGIDEARLRRAFLEEAEELSQKLGDSLLTLESARGDSDILNEVFRFTHSLKSESALMGFTKLSELAHHMEDLLGLARDGKIELNREVIDRIFVGSDLIAEMMSALSKGGSDADFDTRAALADLADAAGMPVKAPARSGISAAQHAATPAAGQAGAPEPAGDGGPRRWELGEQEKRLLSESKDRGEGLYDVVVCVDEAEAMKFPRAYLVFSNLELVANVVKVSPVMEGDFQDDALYASTSLLLTTGAGKDGLEEAARVDQIASVQITQLDYASLLSRASKPAPNGTAVPPSEAQPAAEADAAAAEPAPEQGRKAPATGEKTSIRVDTRKLDDLWSLIAELVLRKSQIARISDSLGRGADVNAVREELVESFDSLDKISGGMQQAMMDTRMIPISVIFNKFPRLVRDLSRKLGKPVELALSGEDTEIDRSVVEALSDPLTHIIRNSLDHGIEFPEERVRQGKTEKGTVSVSARRQGGNIVIELADDGRGMDSERIRQKAIAKGFAGAEAFSEAQLLELVFLPGFSTKEVVTDVSGRGVGMDVVATRIRGDLKGDVVLRTEPGKGTRVMLLLPLTLTIVNALLVRGEQQLYALPLTDVDSTAKLLSSDINVAQGRETALWLDEEIPVFSLGNLFADGRGEKEEYFAAVLRHGEKKAFLIVDELIEEREIVIKPVDDLLNSRRLFSGVSVLEDGLLVFILDTYFIQREDF
jgi:two-component system, chemotaxis family, sensor kinase CheA